MYMFSINNFCVSCRAFCMKFIEVGKFLLKLILFFCLVCHIQWIAPTNQSPQMVRIHTDRYMSAKAFTHRLQAPQRRTPVGRFSLAKPIDCFFIQKRFPIASFFLQISFIFRKNVFKNNFQVFFTKHFQIFFFLILRNFSNILYFVF